MIIIAIEHCNGEIMDKPFIIKDLNRIKDFWLQGYLIYTINLFNGTTQEIKF